MKALRLLLLVLLPAAFVACSDSGNSPANPAAPNVVHPSLSSATTTKSGGKTANIDVTTIVNDVDASGVAADIASDGMGAYTNGTASVISILTANGYNGITWGDWQFDTLSSPTRRVGHSFDADDEILSGDPRFTALANPPYLGLQAFPSRIEVKCTLESKDMLTMGAGTSMTCPMVGRFTMLNGDDYGFGPAESFTGYSETTDIQIVCNSANSGGCNDWFLEPIGSQPAVGRLVLASTSHGKQGGATDEGDFLIRFLIHVTRP